MTTYENVVDVASVPSAKTRATLSSTIRSLVQRLVVWVEASADRYAAAAMYEQLSRLSDAELHRRGLSRDILARDVGISCD